MKKLTLQFVYSFVMRRFLRWYVGVELEVASFLKEYDQFIIVANHNSHLDTMSLMSSVPRSIVHKVRPVAAADHFGKTKLKGKLTNYFVNSLLIQRKRDKENPENDPINQMIKALDEGYSLIIFPEGTRGEPEVKQALKPGVALVLKERPNVPFVPAYMEGMGKAMPKDDALIVPVASKLIYGQAQKIEANDTVESILSKIEQALIDLSIKIDEVDD